MSARNDWSSRHVRKVVQARESWENMALRGVTRTAESRGQWRKRRGRDAPDAIGDTAIFPPSQGLRVPTQGPGQRGELNLNRDQG